MKNLLKSGSIFAILFALFLSSCDATVTVISQSDSKDGALSAVYEGTLGPALTKLVDSLSEGDEINFQDYLNGHLLFKKNPVERLELSPENLVTMYETCDEETRDLIDLFLSPVFSGEALTEEEYLETVASVYGKDVAEELSKSIVHIEVNGKKKEIPLPKLLTLDEIIDF